MSIKVNINYIKVKRKNERVVNIQLLDIKKAV